MKNKPLHHTLRGLAMLTALACTLAVANFG